MAASDPRANASDLLGYIGRSPSPWHAVATTVESLQRAGFTPLKEGAAWQLEPGRGYYVVRDGSSIIAFRLGSEPLSQREFRMVGAHTDSPGFRVKPRGAHMAGRVLRVGVEVYGGPILATFADRDLTLAGRVLLHEPKGGISSRLVNFGRPILRLPNPAIHLNREVNSQGLRFDPQEELPLVLAVAAEELPAQEHFRKVLARELEIEPEAVSGWELAAADTQPGSLFGIEREFIASPQLDNLASCHAALQALLAVQEPEATTLCAFFDHEEIGSQSYKGAEGTFLPDTLLRIAEAQGISGAAYRQVLARSFVISADMAHAWHPNFARFYDEGHAVHLNAGPVIKINAKQSYATDGIGEAYVEALAARRGVPIQKYVHRNNLPCGSTIGPITAARLGVRTVDVGNPMWSMHSLRESAGAIDHGYMIALLSEFFTDSGPVTD